MTFRHMLRAALLKEIESAKSKLDRLQASNDTISDNVFDDNDLLALLLNFAPAQIAKCKQGGATGECVRALKTAIKEANREANNIAMARCDQVSHWALQFTLEVRSGDTDPNAFDDPCDASMRFMLHPQSSTKPVPAYVCKTLRDACFGDENRADRALMNAFNDTAPRDACLLIVAKYYEYVRTRNQHIGEPWDWFILLARLADYKAHNVETEKKLLLSLMEHWADATHELKVQPDLLKAATRRLSGLCAARQLRALALELQRPPDNRPFSEWVLRLFHGLPSTNLW